LSGYTYSRLLGMGGFADVFLYHQQLPAREVAVKVLLEAHLDDATREQFVTEANLMARLSQHPAIVTVHHAGFASDGRPYLVMEHCSRPGLAERYRAERLSVAECLRIGIRLASAVQTAHDAGVVHRDIKPANVLTTDFGWPALTDFGIAAAVGLSEAAGMSIPWAPPELLGLDHVSDERSDLYSLAATVYSMLAGRSPFEVPGTRNSARELVDRIEHMALPPIGRSDVPAELVEILARAMSRKVEDRPPSAIAFACSLQTVEAAMGLPMTALDLIVSESDVATGGPREVPGLDDTTRDRQIVEPDTGETRAGSVIDRRAAKVRSSERSRRGTDQGGSASRTGGRRAARALVAVASLALVAVVVATAVVLGRPGSEARPTLSQHPGAPATVEAVVPTPADLVGTWAGDGSVAFTWTNPLPADGDRYQWVRLAPGSGSTQRAVTDTASVAVAAGPGESQVCIEVSILRADGRLSTRPAVGCVP